MAQWAILIDKKDIEFAEGEGIHGQAAQNKKIIKLSDISDNIIIITSSSGKTSPKSLYIIPLLIENETEFLIEFASFKSDDEDEFEAIKVLAEKLQSLIEKAK
jgi:two-component system chemotaxis sensor kinase CheA